MNNEMQWNSTFLMIERALRKQTDIMAFLFSLQDEQDTGRRIPADDMLSNEDWRVLGEVHEILKPVYLQIMRTQGRGKGDNHGRLWEILIGIEYLLEHFEDWKVFYSEAGAETIRATHSGDLELTGTPSVGTRESDGQPNRMRRLPARHSGTSPRGSQNLPYRWIRGLSIPRQRSAPRPRSHIRVHYPQTIELLSGHRSTTVGRTWTSITASSENLPYLRQRLFFTRGSGSAG